MLDYIIVGQGLAGSLLSFMLLKKGKKIAVVDNNFSTSSSMAAAGIINPITGRHFVKSWKTDELYPVFTQTYLEISELIQKQIFHPKNVSILFREVENLNNWLGRSTDANLDGFHSNNIDQKKYLETFGKDLIEVVDFNFSGRCDLKSLLLEWKKYLKNIQIPYLEEEFDYNSLEFNYYVIIKICESITAVFQIHKKLSFILISLRFNFIYLLWILKVLKLHYES